VPGVLSEINTTLSQAHINILGQYLATNEQIGYVVLDVDKKLSKNALALLKEVKDFPGEFVIRASEVNCADSPRGSKSNSVNVIGFMV